MTKLDTWQLLNYVDHVQLRRYNIMIVVIIYIIFIRQEYNCKKTRTNNTVGTWRGIGLPGSKSTYSILNY